MSAPKPKFNAGPNALRRGRASVPNSQYFVTLCIEPRRPVLIPTAAVGILAEAQLMSADTVWSLRCMTVMPDHIHLLIRLGETLTLSQCIARLKVKTKALVSHSAETIRWQDNYYDHQIRADEPIEPVIRYIWLNSYQAGLIARDDAWPHFYCSPEDWAWFEGLTERGLPFPEWLR